MDLMTFLFVIALVDTDRINPNWKIKADPGAEQSLDSLVQVGCNLHLMAVAENGFRFRRGSPCVGQRIESRGFI